MSFVKSLDLRLVLAREILQCVSRYNSLALFCPLFKDGTDVAENWSRHDLLITLVEMEKAWSASYETIKMRSATAWGSPAKSVH